MPVRAGTEPLLDTGRDAPSTLRDHVRLIDQNGNLVRNKNNEVGQ
jgi:hypothetical protein